MKMTILAALTMTAMSVNAQASDEKIMFCSIVTNPVASGDLAAGEQLTLATDSDKISGSKEYARVVFSSVLLKKDLALGNDNTVSAQAMLLTDGGATATLTYAGVTASTGVIRPTQSGHFEVNWMKDSLTLQLSCGIVGSEKK